MQSQEEEHEVVYDVDFDRNRALTKAFAATSEVSTAPQLDAAPERAPVAAAQIRQQGLLAKFIGHMRGAHGSDGDDDEDDGLDSILTFHTPAAPPVAPAVATSDAPSNTTSNITSNATTSTAPSTGAAPRSVRQLPSKPAAITTRPTATPARRPPAPVSQRPAAARPTRNVASSVQVSPAKTLLSHTFGAASERPAAWSSAPPVAAKKRPPVRKQPMVRPTLDTSKKPKVYESVDHERSMADVLSQATSQASSSTSRLTPRLPRVVTNHEEIEDSGAGIPLDSQPSFLLSPTQATSVLKRKDASRRKEYHIVGPIGQAVLGAARKLNRDSTLFHSSQASSLQVANPALDLPQHRPFITICVLRRRSHANFVVLTSFVHDVSDAAYFASTTSSTRLCLAPAVFLDAVYAAEKAPAPGRRLLKLYAPLHAIAVDGNHPFPLLLGTNFLEVLETDHHCDATLPSLS
ncbi:hypothetical protein SDRG_09525 [Saprolegnia diclina VS20]|uniref:Uncharacterized protein n=1 Tax=Saprolegnia diclina (strain VS20) TaxID=1156394 RepID=T0RL64_SAPDV|nr:hypothetical protein SDRG_09525 [Saprolegnia diclina VS20]EQC33003.1 hypothetical protein SDRG_09525 [Saprolegnia diclina VS20]|eukprot:XP_008613689.1 hypothetical protein SDRG_09525 [Saprolegnia diclina VS20]